MRQVPLDIVAGSYADETRPFSSQDTVNYLPVFAEQGGTRTPTMLKTPPGLRPFVEVRDASEDIAKPIGPVRRTHNCEGKLFAVMGQTLYQVTPSGVAIPQGIVPGISRCSMAHNQLATGNQLVTVNGTSGYVFNTQTQVFERITDEGFPGAIKVIFMDGYIVGIEPRRRFAFCSEVADALAYNTLDRFTSEYLPDLLVSLESVQNQLVLFSEGSMEFFENTGATEQPFRSKRISQKRGCAGTFTTAVIDQTVYWLGDDGIFYRLEGYAPRRISTRPIEQAIRGLDWRNAFAETWTDAGHLVVYWTFPDGMTWGYDISSGQWHRRQSYGFNRWRPNTLTYINSEWVAGDFQNGRLWKLDWDYVLEGDDEIISERVTQTLADNQNRMLVSRVELIVDTGQPLTTPVDFPLQPEGPSISGDAPNGTVGIPWGPYNYIATGGTPPYRFLLFSGELPDGIGPLEVDGEIPAVTPGDVSSGEFVVRVVDANGLFDDVNDSIDIGEGWLLAASFTDTGELKRSPDGVSWDSPSFRVMDGEDTWQPYFEGTAFSRSGAEVIGYSGIGFRGIWSTDHGKTFTALPIPGSVINGFRCAKAGPLWWIPRGNVTDVATWDGNAIEDGPFQANAVLEYGGTLFSARVGYGYLYNRGTDGSGTGEVLFTGSGSSLINVWLEKSDDEIAILWLDVSGNLHIERSIDGGASVETCVSPFSAAPGDTKCFARFNRRESLWVIVFGNRVAYGPDLTALTQSAHVFAATPRGIDEDGTKFVVCGDDRLLESSVDGDVWASEPPPSDTTSGTDLAALLAPAYEV